MFGEKMDAFMERNEKWVRPTLGTFGLTLIIGLGAAFIWSVSNVMDRDNKAMKLKQFIESPLAVKVMQDARVVRLGCNKAFFVVNDTTKKKLIALKKVLGDDFPLHLINPNRPAIRYSFSPQEDSDSQWKINYTTPDKKHHTASVGSGSVIWVAKNPAMKE